MSGAGIGSLAGAYGGGLAPQAQYPNDVQARPPTVVDGAVQQLEQNTRAFRDIRDRLERMRERQKNSGLGAGW